MAVRCNLLLGSISTRFSDLIALNSWYYWQPNGHYREASNVYEPFWYLSQTMARLLQN